MSEIALPTHHLLHHWDPLGIDHAPREPKGLFLQTLAQSKWYLLCTDTVAGMSERLKPEPKFIPYF